MEANLTVESLQGEVVQLRQQLTELKQKFGRTMCAFCDWESLADAPDLSDKLQAHMKVCVNHPMRKVEQQLTSAQADCAMKDEALKKLSNYHDTLPQWGFPDIEYCAKKALSPNCGQPLLELVREMKERLEISTTIIGFEEDRGLEVKANQAALTKATQLGF